MLLSSLDIIQIKKFFLTTSLHSVLVGHVIDFEMPVTLSLSIKASIWASRTGMCQVIKHIYQND